MKILDLSILLISLLSNFSLTHASSYDCDNLNKFLKRNSSTNCDHVDSAGNIIELSLSCNDIQDLSDFPIFEKLEILQLDRVSDNVLPSRFFDQPELKILTVTDSNIVTVPKNINKNCPVTEINLENNAINEFPSQFQVLPNLQHLYLCNNTIPGIIDLAEFKTLTEIDIGNNQVEEIKNIPKQTRTLFMNGNKPLKKIPEEVSNLLDLVEFDFSNTPITEIPPNLFKLEKLQIFKHENNKNLVTPIINFGNKNIKECSFDGTPISCYQKGTCASINKSIYPACTDEQINEIKNKQVSFSSSTSSNHLILGGGIAVFVIIVIIILAAFE